MPALRAGGRYVWHEPVVRRILLRVIVFVAPAMALWALLPLVARQQLGLGAGGYGALFGALGVGAIVGALVLGRVRDHLSTNGLLTAAGAALRGGFGRCSCWPRACRRPWSILVLAGLAWMAVISTLNAELQLFLPVWVRARGLAVYMVVFTGSQTVGALVWGLVAERVGVRPAFLVAAVVAAGRRRRRSRLARAGDRPPRPRAGRLLARGAAGLRPRARHRTRARHRRVHGHAGAGGRPSSRRWTTSASLDVEPARLAGSCTATANDRTASSRSSASRRGRNTCVSTTVASPRRTGRSRRRRLASRIRRPVRTTCSPRSGVPSCRSESSTAYTPCSNSRSERCRLWRATGAEVVPCGPVGDGARQHSQIAGSRVENGRAIHSMFDGHALEMPPNHRQQPSWAVLHQQPRRPRTSSRRATVLDQYWLDKAK